MANLPAAPVAAPDYAERGWRERAARFTGHWCPWRRSLGNARRTCII